ncbi:hypothetical protein P872_04515 [Rhodonellum psychrophilum GCM71 = DSM 17998]|uniref:Chromosome segregation protein n=2 Tax=Rhodonellum TaxID=336827 RepID=U5C0X8_9BACT|nr:MULTISPECIES: DUF349 domain-containing protein [Rhodonellum]ERM82581.1 hypothetical protein P872_04515 [Rhodonellum psychrophilum GCM71 = DSM 17998]MDO9553890.1 DUF349 domain-containing protein [Rhodonellum sp.]SDZ53260.1 protein of unknown function [Rhodonellum ikkaensis]
MNTDKEMSEEDKVTQAIDENQAHGIEVTDDVSTPSEEESSPNEGGEEAVDYSHFSKSELIQAIKELAVSENIGKVDSQINEIKTSFDDFFNKEKEEALQDFVSNGGDAADFEYKPTDEDKDFLAAYHQFRERKASHYKEMEKQKEKNLYAKNKILDTLRDLVDGEETTHSITTIKDIQEEWKKIGPVPNAQNRNLWASFNALMDRFYDNRSIYFELKELDRKKNLELKTEICEKAEALVNHEELRDAIKTLNDLHEEYKHVGPVPREEQENLWQRFKAASDAIYAKRKEFYEGQKEVFKDNLKFKETLIEKLEAYKDFNGGKIKDWNAKTKEVLAVQKEWEIAGSVPKDIGKDVNKRFWGLFKQFFHNKNQFFKELDDIRLVNRQKAEELIEKAESFKDSEDWQTAANKLIALQQEWRKLGPTPEKVRNDLYTRFKAACDAFFENRRNANKQVNREFEQNLEEKEVIISKIAEEAKGKTVSIESLEKMILEFNTIGFVPRKNMKEVLVKFNEAIDTYVSAMGVAGIDREEFLFRLNLNKLQSDPNSDRVLNKKEHGIRKQISDLENNVTLWKNNLEFFASSKTADKLRDQFDEKIIKAETEIEKLKKKLSIIREF